MSDSPGRSVRYLVAWGGDKRSQDALALGVDLATTFAAGLDVLYVLQEESVLGVQHPGERDFRDRVEAQARQALQREVADLPAELDVRLHVRRAPSVTQGILDEIPRVDARLLVIGAGASGGTRFVANAVAGALLHASPVPVAMATRRYRRTERGPLDELTVAIGTRPGAQLVLDESVAGAARVGLPLRLVSLVDGAGRSDEELVGRAETTRELLDGLRERVVQAGGSGLDVQVDVGHGRTLKKAVDHLDWSRRSVLMVGSSRLAQGRQTFLGSTATRLLGHLPVPMIVVPRPE